MRLKRFWRTSCVLGRFSVGLEFSADAFPYEAPDKPQMPAEGSLSQRGMAKTDKARPAPP